MFRNEGRIGGIKNFIYTHHSSTVPLNTLIVCQDAREKPSLVEGGKLLGLVCQVTKLFYCLHAFSTKCSHFHI